MQNVGEIEGIPVQITWHCLSRAVEMGVDADKLKDLILRPEHIYNSKKCPGDIMHRHGDFSIAICLDETMGVYVIKTVLYGSMAAWIAANEAGLLPEDRELRLDIGMY